MTDFNNPTNSSNYATVLSTLNSKIASVAKMDFTGDTNLETNFLRYNRTSRAVEQWSGSAWVQQSLEPAGIIKAFGGTTAPAGHLLCNGAAVSRTTYAALFAVISTTYGPGDGATTFNLPNLQGRFPLGRATSGTGSTLGGTGGSLDHTHTVPAHYHGMGTGANLAVDISHNHDASSVSGTVGSSTNGTHTHTHTLTTALAGAHSHTYSISYQTNTVNSDSSSNTRLKGTDGTGTTRTNTSALTLNDSEEHFHAVTGSITSTGSGHTHSHNLTAAGQTLGATSKTPTGNIGLVTGGVNGNAQMTSGANNPAFQVVNYIITI